MAGAMLRTDQVAHLIGALVSGLPHYEGWTLLDMLLAPDESLGASNHLNALRSGDLIALQRNIAQANGDGFA